MPNELTLACSVVYPLVFFFFRPRLFRLALLLSCHPSCHSFVQCCRISFRITTATPVSDWHKSHSATNLNHTIIQLTYLALFPTPTGRHRLCLLRFTYRRMLTSKLYAYKPTNLAPYMPMLPTKLISAWIRIACIHGAPWTEDVPLPTNTSHCPSLITCAKLTS